MPKSWVHVGRLWTNGEPFLALDDALRQAWRGASDDEFDKIVELGPDDTSIPVGPGSAALVGSDGVVRDESWIEVFQAAHGPIAIVQASGPDYPHALTRALDHPSTEDQDGCALNVPSATLALFSAAVDGAGPHSTPLLPARPGPVPPVHGPPSRGGDPGLLLPTTHTAYKLRVRWYTKLDANNCFARWLLIPGRDDG